MRVENNPNARAGAVSAPAFIYKVVMKIKTLIEALQKFPQESEVKVHERGAVWDSPITEVTADKEGRKNLVIIYSN